MKLSYFKRTLCKCECQLFFSYRKNLSTKLINYVFVIDIDNYAKIQTGFFPKTNYLKNGI